MEALPAPDQGADNPYLNKLKHDVFEVLQGFRGCREAEGSWQGSFQVLQLHQQLQGASYACSCAQQIPGARLRRSL